MRRILLLVLILSAAAAAQNDPVTTTVATRKLQFPLLSPPPIVIGGNAGNVGNPGNATYFYWVVANATIGSSSPSGPIIATGAPSTLNGSNYVQVSWTAVAGASSYDLLRTSTPAPPSGACGCAVATALTSPTASDQSNALNAYTVNPLNTNSLTLTITNETFGAGASHLILRQNGTQIADLSVGGGTSIINTNVQTNDVACWNGTNYVNCPPGQTQNVQSGTTYTFVTTDNTKVIQLTNSGVKTITVPDATTAGTPAPFGAGWFVDVCNANTGAVTFNRSGANTINGATSITLAAATTTAPLCLRLNSDGTNWRTSQMGASSGGGGSAVSALPIIQNGGMSQSLAAATTYYLRVSGNGNPGTSSAATNIQIPNPLAGTLATMYCTAAITVGTGNAGDTFTLTLDYDSVGDGTFATSVFSATSTSLSASGNFVTASATGGATSITAGNRLRLKLITPGAWLGAAPTLQSVSCTAKVTGAS